MKLWVVACSAMVGFAVACPSFPAFAQVVPDTSGTRGVRILRPEETPKPPEPAAPVAPAPTPVSPPSPPPKPAPQAVVAPVIKLCARPVAAPDIKLPIANFDRALARKLRTGRRVVVDLDKPFPQRDAAPAPLGPWLSEVTAGGGEVTVRQYCDSARGGLGAWLAKLFGSSEPAGNRYKSARAYDAVLHADALDRVVTQVEFNPKASRAKP